MDDVSILAEKAREDTLRLEIQQVRAKLLAKRAECCRLEAELEALQSELALEHRWFKESKNG